MGEVYLAKDTRLNRQVALKLLELKSAKTKIARTVFGKKRLPHPR